MQSLILILFHFQNKVIQHQPLEETIVNAALFGI
jgi:hypothetical protein